ncbi:hypothetical protein COB21_03505 [Candidatus Aerophobetes bacterium]|uniref:OmpA-like domain-containing protein n=1 Tax=Aerophobetes bacterium TaxID=2030807 RepID=A0A2A4X4Z6_UNCAE|nr:MAG: hypothetical protein COB21_03505 [Candidatus Aerophobetes bacterium]
MRKKLLPYLLPIAISLLTTSCHHSSGAVWEDTKTLGRYLHRKSRMLWQKNVDSKMIEEEGDLVGPASEEYIPMDNAANPQANMQSKTPLTPLMHQSTQKKPHAITRELFQVPKGPLATIFQNIYFNTDRYTIRSKKEYKCLQEIASNMKNNPDWFLFVEGHTDERASEQYNLALGSKRANSVRKQLISLGVSPSNVFTLSLGKEMPAEFGHGESAWSKNRRVIFKLYKDNQSM